MGASDLWVIDRDGRVFLFSLRDKSWRQISTPKLGSRNCFKRISAVEQCAWAISASQQPYVFLHANELPIRVKVETYENQRWGIVNGWSRKSVSSPDLSYRCLFSSYCWMFFVYTRWQIQTDNVTFNTSGYMSTVCVGHSMCFLFWAAKRKQFDSLWSRNYSELLFPDLGSFFFRMVLMNYGVTSKPLISDSHSSRGQLSSSYMQSKVHSTEIPCTLL